MAISEELVCMPTSACASYATVVAVKESRRPLSIP